jgi:TatD DNase family protein
MVGPRMIDTHAHLDGSLDAPAMLERARAAGVDRVITVGTTIDSCREALELAGSEPGVYAALGIHPHDAGGEEANRLGELRVLLADERAVAVGETGLDFYRDYAPRAAQRRLFEAELELARELQKPVVVHTRAADEATLDALQGFGGTVVLHCFSSPPLLDAALERGYYVSFAGNVTYPKAGDLRQCAARVPADRILAETDSPYLSPQPVRGKPNEPANVVHTVEVLADARGEDADELAARIGANATVAFSLP